MVGCKKRFIVVFAIAACIAHIAYGGDPEFRAMWISRFEWPDADEATCRARISTAMQQMADADFNAVFFQIRGQMDTFYPSEESWSELIGGVDPGWDPVAFAVSEAHKHGLEFHAYINTHTCWESKTYDYPADPNHTFYAHCNAADPNARDWLIHDVSGNPVQWQESNYVWVAPGVPAFQAYLRKQVMHVVENYDVDGIHFDRIRTPNADYSFDPISMARLNDPQSNPEGLAFTPWTADQITRNVRNIYAAIMDVKPYIKVSAAVFRDPALTAARRHQDAVAWIQTGAMDMLTPMIYITGGVDSPWDNYLKDWITESLGRHIVAGHITSQGIDSLIEQVRLSRTREAQGTCVFSWGSFSFWDDYTSQVYYEPVPIPEMEWKTQPETGFIVGYLTDVSGTPVVDGHVNCGGIDYTALTSGDGFYAFLNIQPGMHTLTFSLNGTVCEVKDVEVFAGRVAHADALCSADCNGNGVPDHLDIAGSTSDDCDLNAIPDECQDQSDCNSNTVLDFCDIADGVSGDCNTNGIPDECESPVDCNQNGVPDFCDLATANSADCNHNSIPDECESQDDCNGNSILDICEPQEDCNGNGIQDICDVIDGGVSADCNTNSVPDECEAGGDCSGNMEIGSASTATWNYPFATYFHDARTTSIYLASEIGCNGGLITGLQYHVVMIPGQVMENFTIRLRHTSLASYSSPEFEVDNWHTAYQADATVTETGWYGFTFSDPFEWNGVDNIEIDVCFNNDEWTSDGAVYSFIGGGLRSKFYQCDSCSCGTTNPLTWTCQGNLTTAVPRIVLEMVEGSGADCNNNGMMDECDVIAGVSDDINFNRIPDECETIIDCNNNNIDDTWEIAREYSADCDENGIPDDCDSHDDCNDNGVPDICEMNAEVMRLMLAENFDNGLPASGWQVDGLWHSTNACGESGECAQSQWAYFGFDGQCDFDNGSSVSGTITSPVIRTKPSERILRLKYCSAYAGEAGVAGSGGWDWAYVTVNGVIVDNPSRNGSIDGWETRTVDLSDFAGLDITLAWHFDSRDGRSNDHLGWQIDNIELISGKEVYRDCNNNTVLDDCDIADGLSQDRDQNDIPDECQQPPVDCDDNGIMNMTDLAAFEYCLLGPSHDFTVSHFCRCADVDEDRNVDLADFAVMQAWFAGNNPE